MPLAEASLDPPQTEPGPPRPPGCPHRKRPAPFLTACRDQVVGVTVYMALSLQYPAQLGSLNSSGTKLNSLERQDGHGEGTGVSRAGVTPSSVISPPRSAPAPCPSFLSSDRTGLHAFPLMALQVQFQLPGLFLLSSRSSLPSQLAPPERSLPWLLRSGLDRSPALKAT